MILQLPHEDAILQFMNQNTPQKHPLLLVGDWKPYQTEQELDFFLEELKKSLKGASYAFYAALPFTLIKNRAPSHQKEHPSTEAKELPPEGREIDSSETHLENFFLGSNTMMRLTPHAFTASIALSLFKKSHAQFVLFNAFRQKEVIQETEEETRSLLYKLLDENILVLFNLGPLFQNREETPESPFPDSLYEWFNKTMEASIKKKLQTFLEGLPETAASQLCIVVPALPDIACEPTSLSKALFSLHTTVRSLLEEVLGSEQAEKIRLLAPVPRFLKECASFMQNTPFDGFLFTLLAYEKDLVLKTLAGPLVEAEHPIAHPAPLQEEKENTREEEIDMQSTPETPLSKQHKIRNLTAWGELDEETEGQE